MRSWRMEIEYEGTRYAGWQRQPVARTVQGEIERAAREFFGADATVGGSGRTDAGVHALAQVAHLRLKPSVKTPHPRQMLTGLNKLLPHDVNIKSLRPADANFDARRDAVARVYLYQISTRRTAFGKSFVWWVRDNLDIGAMAEASAEFVGRQDFRSFSEIDEAKGSTIVHVNEASVTRHDSLILFRIGASHFLWKMVRRLTGALVEVGRGNLSRRGVRALLEKPTREPAAWTAPPSGLFLERVLYKGETFSEPPAPAFHRMSL